MQKQSLKLDYTIQSPEQRRDLVQKIVNQHQPQQLSKYYLKILADYIIFAMTKQQKKQKKINTQNRMVTINKRQTSFEGLISKFENGEDGIYNMIVNDKNILLSPKISITQQDLAEIPELAELRQEILKLEEIHKTARGKRKFLLKKQLIQMRQDQYVIKMSYKQPIYCINTVKNFGGISFEDNIQIKNNEIIDNSMITLTKSEHVSALLRNYSNLKENCYGRFYMDGYYIIQDLENLIDSSIKEKHPLYFKLMVYKIDGKSNLEIQQLLYNEFNILHSIEYISVLWRKKIPKLIAEQAQKNYLQWYFTMKQKGKWKKCSRCGEIKLAHNKFFSRNSSSKDNFYSICKECRNRKTLQSKNKKILIIKRIPYKGQK